VEGFGRWAGREEFIDEAATDGQSEAARRLVSISSLSYFICAAFVKFFEANFFFILEDLEEVERYLPVGSGYERICILCTVSVLIHRLLRRSHID
jgi:hypothetical protein